MQPQFVSLPKQKIAYYESSGSGPALLFIHGNSASAQTFQYQLNSPLGETYRLVAVDLPGHGRSDPAPNLDDYGMPGYAATLTAVANALNLTEAVLVGWSLGGHIALEMHNHLPQARGFVIYGTPPLAFPPDMEAAFLPNPAVNIGFAPDVTEEQAQTYATSFFDPANKVDVAPFVADILQTDGRARAGLGASIKPDGYQDEVEIVATLTRPLAVLHGENEQLVNASYISGLAMPSLWRGAVQMIPQAGHAPHWENTAVFNALLTDFMQEI